MSKTGHPRSPSITEDEHDTNNFKDSALLLNTFVVRHTSQMIPVLVQCLLILCSALLICGIVYFILFTIGLTVHQIIIDPKVTTVPEFVHSKQIPKSTHGSFDEDSEGMEYYDEITRRQKLNRNWAHSRHQLTTIEED